MSEILSQNPDVHEGTTAIEKETGEHILVEINELLDRAESVDIRGRYILHPNGEGYQDREAASTGELIKEAVTYIMERNQDGVIVGAHINTYRPLYSNYKHVTGGSSESRLYEDLYVANDGSAVYTRRVNDDVRERHFSPTDKLAGPLFILKYIAEDIRRKEEYKAQSSK